MRRKLVMVFLVTITFLVLFTPVVNESYPYANALDNDCQVFEKIPNKDMIPAQELNIDNNEDFTQSGFTGSGTVEDPFVLEDKILQDSVVIRETSAYFEIRNCQFIGGYSDHMGSIRMSYLSNGLVSGCVITSGGLFLFDSTDCTLKDNIVFTESIIDTNHQRMIFPGGGLGWGIIVGTTNYSVIENNTVFHTAHGIEANGHGLTVKNNIIHSNLFSGLVAAATESFYVGNSIFGHIEQVYGHITYGGYSAIESHGENSTFYNNKIGWNHNHVMIADYGGVNPNQWDNGVDAGNAWDDYMGSGPYVLETDNVDNHPSLLEDSVAPIVNGPNDIEREWGSPSNLLRWTIEEDFPTQYEIYLDDELVWGGGIFQETIEYPLTGIALGNYTLTFMIFDAAGQYTNHSINVEVIPMNHNLRWGIEANSTLVFDFFTAKDTTTTATHISDQLIMTVTELPDIPDTLFYVPLCPYETDWVQSNDTLAPLEYYFAGAGLVWSIISPAVPVGNWSLLSSFVSTVESESLNISIIDEAFQWGIRVDMEEGDFSFTSETTWLKSDGSLLKVLLSIGTPEGSAEVSLRRSGVVVEPLMVIIVAIGIIGAAGVLIVVRSRRG